MFVDTEPSLAPNLGSGRPSPETLLAMLRESERAKLRVYIGAAAGVGKTYQMLEDAHQLKKQGVDVVVGVVECHGRVETIELVRDLETVPLKRIDYSGSVFSEMDLAGLILRKPAVAI